VYQTFPSWLQSTTDVRRFDALPREAQSYLGAVEKITATPIRLLSVGSDREQTIIR
jgi:adenylosuccinate synthase